MPRYDIDCRECGPRDIYARMHAMRKEPHHATGKVVTHRKCDCGLWSPVLYLQAPGGIVDAPADSKPFKVAGIEGTFSSHHQLEKHCRENNLDLSHTGDSSWKKSRIKARAGAEALATEMGYRNLNAYKKGMKDSHTVQQKINEAKERKGLKRA